MEEDFDPRLNELCVGDIQRIQRVLVNLTSNARFFVPKVDGLIQIKTTVAEADGANFLKISVTDNGLGVSKENRKKLFSPFSKQHLNPNSSGISLNICKLICNCLGGDITVDKELDRWSKFTFWVKLR